ncbi:TPA: tail fiber assembly protein [Escherichia coli]|nr:tail fiber assembly protein [Escherichia coli]HAH8847042.1 tail fiber assembly protein [Escherichia coli]
MLYFKNKKKSVYAYEDDVSPELFADGLTAITKEEAMALLNPPPTAEQLAALAEEKRLQLRSVADSEIAWRQDAVDAEIATDAEKTALAAWKKYRVMLMRVDVAKPEWPVIPS